MLATRQEIQKADKMGTKNKEITFHKVVFGAKMKELREKKYPSVQQFAQLTDYSEQSIRQIEKGRQIPPKTRDINVLFEVLGLRGDERQTMLQCWHKARQKEWTESHSDVIEQGYNLYFQYERYADNLFLWCDKVIHGLFHDDQYTEHARDLFAFYPEARGNQAIFQMQQERREKFWSQFTASPEKKISLLLGPSVFHILQQMPQNTYMKQIEHLVHMGKRPGVDIRYTGYINTLVNVNNFSLLEIAEPGLAFLHIEYLRTHGQPEDPGILEMHRYYYDINFADASCITKYPTKKE